MNEIRERLFLLKDEKYKNFQCKLMPTVNPEKVIGVRTPDLRKLSKELYEEGKAGEFIKKLPHKYYEEDNLHATFIERITDFDECINELDRFLPLVDNWATCDMMNPKVLKNNHEKLIEKACEWMKSEDTYTVRYGIGVFMRHFLKEDFKVEYAEKIAEIRSEEYYVNMMVAWYFATALAFQSEAILPFFEKQKLPLWTHRKAIQKANESYRITDELKLYLKNLK